MTGAELDADVVVVRTDAYRLDAALHLAAGEIVAVMGPSGAGKSTLLAAIAGQIRLSDGRITIDGTDVASARRHVASARRGVVLLGQEPRLFPHLTARQNVAFGLRARGISRSEAEREADEWLWRVGLPDVGSHRPAELSGGQQQRVAVARALATGPRVLLLDEPLTSLDPETSADIRAMLQEQLAATHATAIVVTHDVIDAAAIAHRLVVIEAGIVTQEGTVRDVLAAPATRFVASIVGVNRVAGRAHVGMWRSSEGDLVLPVSGAFRPGGAGDTWAHPDAATFDPGSARAESGPAESGPAESGPAESGSAESHPVESAAVFRPGDVRVEPVRDQTWTGALRRTAQHPPAPGAWLARVVRLEQTPGGVRVRTTAPDVAVDISLEDAAAWRLTPGMPVRLQVHAADVRWPAARERPPRRRRQHGS